MAFELNPFTNKLDITGINITSIIGGGSPTAVLFVDSAGGLGQSVATFAFDYTYNQLSLICLDHTKSAFTVTGSGDGGFGLFGQIVGKNHSSDNMVWLLSDDGSGSYGVIGIKGDRGLAGGRCFELDGFDRGYAGADKRCATISCDWISGDLYRLAFTIRNGAGFIIPLQIDNTGTTVGNIYADNLIFDLGGGNLIQIYKDGNLLVIDNQTDDIYIQSPFIKIQDALQVNKFVDSVKNEWLMGGEVVDAVNEITITNAATGDRPTISVSGDDTDIGLLIGTKGAGTVEVLTDTKATAVIDAAFIGYHYSDAPGTTGAFKAYDTAFPGPTPPYCYYDASTLRFYNPPGGSFGIYIDDASVLTGNTTFVSVHGLQLETSIFDVHGNELIKVAHEASAVNEFTITNAAAGNSPVLSATGDGTNINIGLTTKGTGALVVTSSATPTQSLLTSGLVVNNAGAGNAADDFTAKTDNYAVGLTIDASDDNIIHAARTTYAPSATQAITAVGNTILANATMVVLDPNGNYTLTSAPTIADGYTGQIVYITCGNAEANIVTVQDQDTLASSNLQLGATSRAISGKDVLVLIFDGTDWLECGFYNN